MASTNLRPASSISRSQAYYWSRIWQRDEAEARRELLEGRGRTFSSGTDAIRWLLSDDD